MDDIYRNNEEQNWHKKQKTLIVFDDMITDMLGNKKLNPIVTELFISRRKLFTLFLSPNITLLFCKILIHLQHTISLKKISNKRELQQIAFNHSSDIDFK